jgi:hypothetical protein
VGRSSFIKEARFLICGSGQFSTVSFTVGYATGLKVAVSGGVGK